MKVRKWAPLPGRKFVDVDYRCDECGAEVLRAVPRGRGECWDSAVHTAQKFHAGLEMRRFLVARANSGPRRSEAQ
jgi:hypothetical protein